YPEHSSILNFPIIGTCGQLEQIIAQENIIDVFIAIGDNKKRLKMMNDTQLLGLTCPNLIHPTAVISSFASLGQGILVMPQASINCMASVDDACIINTAAVIEHDCVLEKGVHVSPNATLAGGVTVGQTSWIGINSAVKEKIQIGRNVIVGAGAVVINNVQDDQTVVGVPAKQITIYERG
ncbi:MAG: acetyltransferase, partial [Gammaproteobacteria bacterium]|nr:acetyltransferase [Gammaproteobacteria bacterium]